MLVDTHCHLHDRQFFTEEQAKKMLERAEKNGVEKIICIGTDINDSETAQDFATEHSNAYWTYGTHPSETNFQNCEQDFRKHLEQLLEKQAEKLVAIGEVGLDYHEDNYDRIKQIRLFEEMLQLAQDKDLPVSFHVREAFEDFFAIIQNFPNIRGVVHSFTDSKKTLKKILENTNFYVGVNGLATYSTLPLPPLERIVLETDAPFLTPKPFRGIINESAYVRNIAEWLAEKNGVELKTIEEETTKNASKIFQFSDSILRKK